MRKRKDTILKLKEELLVRREAIRRALDGDLSMLQELKDHSAGDAADIACEASQDEISSQLVEVESRELGQIEKALKLMESGSYGQCEACGEAIPIARLNALPFATQCVECQESAERRQSTGGERKIDWSMLVDPSAGASYPELELT